MTQTENQDEIIAFLSRPETHGTSDDIRRIDTHGAMVFLAGDRAWKLKRAVHYSYLDFSTADKRRAVCEEELRLNRRTAPEIYLGVRSINRQADGTLGFGPGTPVDWVIEMRRFAAEDLLAQMAEDGRLTPLLMRQLADRIAAFHAGAEEVRGGSGAARMRKIIEGNCASMAEHPDCLPPQDCERLYRESCVWLDRLAPLLDERATAGFVRHCHGDLHLANICLWDGQPTLFDCLEFDPVLASIDVLYDIAFLIMDLWERGLRAEASLVFNRYCAMTGEAEGVAAMPLFLSVRATIRSHITALQASQAEDVDKAAHLRREARTYLKAALAVLDQPAARLVAIGGLSGTGKSTLAQALAPAIGGAPGASWLRTDVLRKRMAGVAPETSLGAEHYTPQRSAVVYDRLLDDAATLLEAGCGVIVDGVFARPEERAEMEALAQEHGAAFTGLWLQAPAHVLKQRVTQREDDASDADAAIVEQQLGYAIGPLAGWHTLDAAGAPKDVFEQALASIGTSN